MSAHGTPHYSHVVHDINNRGGLKIYFGRRGDQGDGWIRHLDTVVPENGVLLHELHDVSAAHHSHGQTPFHTELHKKATERGAAVLPAGYYGERRPNASTPAFKPHDLLLLMPKSAQHITDATLERYQGLQSVREMRAAVGSLAWLAAHPKDYNDRPAVLWGRTHSTSLPDMYERLGIHPVEVKELDAPLRYTYLHPHGLRWSEADIQAAFHEAYSHALTFFAGQDLSRQTVQ